jgi:hypothetical protein
MKTYIHFYTYVECKALNIYLSKKCFKQNLLGNMKHILYT